MTCNLTSQWLYPALEVAVPRLIRENRLHIIVRMMAARRPNSAPLWLGAAITGLLPRLFDFARTYSPSISLETAQWTRSSQSFFDPWCHSRVQFYNDSKNGPSIRREDEFRLLYLTNTASDKYLYPPLCPWPPFGMTALKTAAIEVQKHARCGHKLIYSYWTWQGSDGRTVMDYGVVRKSKSICARIVHHRIEISFSLSHLLARIRTHWRGRSERRVLESVDVSCNEEFSRRATRNLFTWTLSDGTKPDDSAIWNHKWLEDLLDIYNDDDEEDDDVDSDWEPASSE